MCRMNGSALNVQIVRRELLPVADLENMLRLRARFFHERMGWDVRVENGLERDGYDELDPHYLLMKSRDGGVQGCMRLLPTLGPNMLRDVFPSLLAGQPIPADAHAWEISRFALNLDGSCRYHAQRLEHIRAALHQLVGFAREREIHRYVMVTTPTVQRLLAQLDIRAQALSAPTRFGVDEALVLSVPLTAANRRAVAPSVFSMPSAPPVVIRAWQ